MSPFEILDNLGDFIGGVGVIVTLLCLATQIRQNSRMLQASALASATEAYVSFNHLLGSDGEVARVFQVGLEDLGRLSENERRQFLNLLRATFMSDEHVHQNYEAGLIGEGVWKRFRDEGKRLLQIPEVGAWWALRKHVFVAPFVRAMDEAVPVAEQALARELVEAMLSARSGGLSK